MWNDKGRSGYGDTLELCKDVEDFRQIASKYMQENALLEGRITQLENRGRIDE